MLRPIAFSLIVLVMLNNSNAVLRAANEPQAEKPPAVGERAPDFELKNLAGDSISLGNELKHGPVVLVVLRGYPGYQCPICTKQVGELMGKAKAFADAKATVVFVYPGPAKDLDKHATEFVGGKAFPDSFRFLVDPEFKFTELYNLRWDAPKETAYPSSFVIDDHGVVQFAKVSHSHGGRASSSDLRAALAKLAK